MKNWNVLTWILLAAGEAIIIAGFCLFGNSLPDKIFYLDLIVSSVIYLLLFTNIARPMVDLKDPTQHEVGTLGISWSVIGWYSLLALGCMVVLQYNEFAFKYQVIAQAILLFFLVLGFVTSRHTGQKVAEVYYQEKAMLGGLDSVRRQMRNVQDVLAETNGVPADVRQRLDRISESLRYLTPSNNPEAAELEQKLVDNLADVERALDNAELNRELLTSRLSRIERACENRKALFSR